MYCCGAQLGVVSDRAQLGLCSGMSRRSTVSAGRPGAVSPRLHDLPAARL